MESKSVRIDIDTYNQVKEHCDKNALKISRWISKILREKLDGMKKELPGV